MPSPGEYIIIAGVTDLNAAAQTTGYHVVFQRNGGKAGELFWAGTLEETWVLASKIAPQYGAEIFRIES
jgi:hypothetical protein